MSPVHLAIGFSFFSRFPHGRHLGKQARWAEILLYLVTIPLWLSADLLERATTQKAFLGSPVLLASRALHGLYSASIEAVCVVAFLICLTLLLNYRRVVEPLEKRRARWVVYGCIFGLLPWALWATAVLFLRWTSLGGTANSGFMAVSGQLANLAIGVIPIVAGIAIAQNRLFEVHVVVRRGVQYLLARSVLQAALTTPVVVLGIFVYLGRHRTLVEIVFQNSALFYIAASSALGLLFRKQLQEWLDRRFFRSSYDREKLLMSLSDEIRHLDSPEQVADLVIHRIEEALHPGTVLVVIASPGQPEPRVFASAGVVEPESGASGLLTFSTTPRVPSRSRRSANWKSPTLHGLTRSWSNSRSRCVHRATASPVSSCWAPSVPRSLTARRTVNSSCPWALRWRSSTRTWPCRKTWKSRDRRS